MPGTVGVMVIVPSVAPAHVVAVCDSFAVNPTPVVKGIETVVPVQRFTSVN